MDFNELSDELKAKAIECKTPEDMLALAKEEGYELADEELDAVSGGGFWSCDDCGSDSCSAVCGPGCGIVDQNGNKVNMSASGDTKVFLM